MKNIKIILFLGTFLCLSISFSLFAQDSSPDDAPLPTDEWPALPEPSLDYRPRYTPVYEGDEEEAMGRPETTKRDEPIQDEPVRGEKKPITSETIILEPTVDLDLIPYLDVVSPSIRHTLQVGYASYHPLNGEYLNPDEHLRLKIGFGRDRQQKMNISLQRISGLILEVDASAHADALQVAFTLLSTELLFHLSPKIYLRMGGRFLKLEDDFFVPNKRNPPNYLQDADRLNFFEVDLPMPLLKFGKETDDVRLVFGPTVLGSLADTSMVPTDEGSLAGLEGADLTTVLGRVGGNAVLLIGGPNTKAWKIGFIGHLSRELSLDTGKDKYFFKAKNLGAFIETPEWSFCENTPALSCRAGYERSSEDLRFYLLEKKTEHSIKRVQDDLGNDVDIWKVDFIIRF